MSYATLKAEAVEQLELAATYAEDGAVYTAILKAAAAIRILRMAETEKSIILQESPDSIAERADFQRQVAKKEGRL